jgi:membrane-bound serine protease (ClpP class)
MPGWGISGTLGLLCLALFFWGHYLAGLANWTEILVFLIGLVLLTLEIFVIPGFGITGILGIGCILAGIFLALIKHPLTIPKVEFNRAFYTLSYAILITVLGILLSLKFIPRAGFWKKIILSFGEKKEEGFQVASSLESYLGKVGRTMTILRPAGRAIFEDKILDVMTEGEFIDRDKTIQIIRVEANKIFVKEI